MVTTAFINDWQQLVAFRVCIGVLEVNTLIPQTQVTAIGLIVSLYSPRLVCFRRKWWNVPPLKNVAWDRQLF